MENSIPESRIWYKIINQLNNLGLDYILVRAAALVIHGLPRSTLDLDIYVPAKEETLNKLFQIADSLRLQSKERKILNISHSPDLFTNQWISFSYKGQDKNMSVRIASLDDIMDMKESAGRAIDLADIKLIKESKDMNRTRPD